MARTTRVLGTSTIGRHPLTRPRQPLVAPVRAATPQDPTSSLTGFVAFQPFDEVQQELAVVEQTSNANGRASLARSGYAEELEAAVNAQIKCALVEGALRVGGCFIV